MKVTVLQRIGRAPGAAGMPVVEKLGVARRVVDLALRIMPPLRDLADAGPDRLVHDGAAACRQRGTALAQHRRRFGLALAPIHDRLPVMWVNETGPRAMLAIPAAAIKRDVGGPRYEVGKRRCRRLVEGQYDGRKIVAGRRRFAGKRGLGQDGS